MDLPEDITRILIDLLPDSRGFGLTCKAFLAVFATTDGVVWRSRGSIRMRRATPKMVPALPYRPFDYAFVGNESVVKSLPKTDEIIDGAIKGDRVNLIDHIHLRTSSHMVPCIVTTGAVKIYKTVWWPRMREKYMALKSGILRVLHPKIVRMYISLLPENGVMHLLTLIDSTNYFPGLFKLFPGRNITDAVQSVVIHAVSHEYTRVLLDIYHDAPAEFSSAIRSIAGRPWCFCGSRFSELIVEMRLYFTLRGALPHNTLRTLFPNIVKN